MKIILCFTIKIINSINYLPLYKELLSKAIECAKLYHNVKFYTDIETLPHIPTDGIEIELIDTSNFYFVDDFKIHLLSVIKDDEVIIDTDLFLFKELYLQTGYDVHTDFLDNSSNKWYTEYLNWFNKNGITELIPNFNVSKLSVPNIGILQVPNKTLRQEYIDLYYKVREWVLLKDANASKGISIVLGQYLLGLLLYTNTEYKIAYCKLNNNHYAHLSGERKFRPNIYLSSIIPIKNKKLI
jgi:hypothetical protein